MSIWYLSIWILWILNNWKANLIKEKKKIEQILKRFKEKLWSYFPSTSYLLAITRASLSYEMYTKPSASWPGIKQERCKTYSPCELQFVLNNFETSWAEVFQFVFKSGAWSSINCKTQLEFTRKLTSKNFVRFSYHLSLLNPQRTQHFQDLGTQQMLWE